MNSIDSVSPAGVSNEQSVGYARYNYLRYLDAADRMDAYDLVPPVGLDRQHCHRPAKIVDRKSVV